jgi:flagellar assembly protein FliH
MSLRAAHDAHVLKAGSFIELFPVEGGVPKASHARDELLEAERERIRRAGEEALALEVSRLREESERKALEEWGHAWRAMRAAAQELHEVAAAGLEAAQEDTIALAVAIAEKVLRREIARDDTFTGQLVRRCLQRIVHKSEVRVRVNPADHAKILAERDTLLRETGLGHEITILADRRVERGGCIVETPDFVVDGTIAGQLRVARAALEGSAS